MPTDREIQERFDDLPHEVQEAIQSANMTAVLQSVGTKYGLHVDKLGLLEDETLLVMLGFGNPAAFPERIRTALALDEQTAAAVAAEISEQLFMPIRVAMRAYMEERLKRSAQPATTAPRPPIFASTAATQSGPTIMPATGGGKTILPSTAQPVLHPTDAMLAIPTVTAPKVTDFSTPGALETPHTAAEKQYASDPYREAVE